MKKERRELNLIELSKNEMEKVRGGDYWVKCVEGEWCCGCGCYYANSGGSSTQDNMNANYKDHLWSMA